MDQSNGYFTITGLAKELDVKKSHIRFCEQNGIIPPRASRLKRRVYNRYDRERLKLVFHFVLLGYSKEQIIDLIGIPDVNLDENDQLAQGIEHSQKVLKKLEKRKEELNFGKQTRIINEIEMLREYINKIKSIKSGVWEEPSAKLSIRFEEKAKIPSESIRGIMTETEEKTAQHPVKAISLFVAGLVLVILVGSYFYYQTGQKETKAIKRVKKKPIHSEKIIEPKAAEPMEDVAKTQVVASEAQKIPGSTAPVQPESVKTQSTDVSIDETERNREIQPESDTHLLKDEKSAEDQLDAHKTDTVSQDDAIPAGKVKETVSSQTSGEKPLAADDALISENQKLISPKVEGALKVDVQKEVAGEDLPEKAAPPAMDEDTLTAAESEPVKEKATEIEVKEALESESDEKAHKVTSDVSLVPEKERLDRPKVEEASKDDVEQEVDTEGLKEKTVPDAAGRDALMAVVPEPKAEKAIETEVKPSLPQSETEMKQITSEEDISQQPNELSRLKSFLDEYCQAYTNKELDKFITFFTSDATENNKPFHELLPDYRKNMESMESLTYRIELTSYSKQTASENLMVRGKFFIRYQLEKGVWEEKKGSIFMELLENGDSFLVKQLNYSN
jgi:DNA-binding transcriptional MerR regulator